MKSLWHCCSPLLLLFGFAAGQQFFIHQQHMQLTIPISNETLTILELHPIVHLKFTDLNRNESSRYKFSLINSTPFLSIHEEKGNIYFDRNKWNQQQQVMHIMAAVKNMNSGEVATATVSFTFESWDLRQFCLERSCFYGNLNVMTTEFNRRKFKEEPREEQIIGDFNPPLYRRICETLKMFYQFDTENGTDFMKVSGNNQLVKTPAMNFEKMKSPFFTTEVTCEVKDARHDESRTHRRLLNYTVIDRNDSPVTVDENSKNVRIYRDLLHFVEGDIVNDNVIIFRDSDSPEANRNVEIKMFDKNELFDKECTTLETPEKNSTATVFICDIRFKRSGHLNETRYCFQLRAFDVTMRKGAHAVSDICVYSSKAIDPLHTTQEATMMSVYTSSNSTSILPNDPVAVTEPSDVTSTPEPFMLRYPQEVEVLQNASRFARVAQPSIAAKDGEQFNLIVNPFGAFGVTKVSGIIYIRQPALLAQAHPTSVVTLEVSWMEHRQQIVVAVKSEANLCADSTLKYFEDFCSRHETQGSCESACGIGSQDGRCKWRAHQGSDLMSPTYSTCVADLEFCSDQNCDELEALGSSLDYQICPQDCSKHVVGTTNSKTIGITGSSKGNVCTCDEDEDCVCGPELIRESKTEDPVTTTTTEMPTVITTTVEISTTTSTSIPNVHHILSDKCGGMCMAMIIGIPSIICLLILIVMSFLVLISRRDHLRSFSSSDSANFSEIRTQQFVRASLSPMPRLEFINELENCLGHPEFYSKRWEIDITNVKVKEIIGEGEFGKVMMASLKEPQGHEWKPAVIKTVKDVENQSEMTCLKKEFEQLQKVACHPHPHVITLIGSCSKGPSPWIILEFCVFESLKDYLMASRLITERTGSDGVDKVSCDDIIRFSLQVARGMSHLSDMKLAHRDLAARNVLLSEGKICKISDFGLTRKVCGSCDVYSKCSDDKVPVKWLAPESLSTSEEYTTKSDVWSYGILGYEIIMLGSSPYPGIVPANHSEFLSMLINGYRMSRPPSCSFELFNIFELCWDFDPSKRPSFQDLTRRFELLQTRDSKDLWSAPEFNDDYDSAYYRDYLVRVQRARTASFSKRPVIRNLSQTPRSVDKSVSSSSSLLSSVKHSKSFKTSRSLNHVENIGYDSSFDSIKFMMRRQESTDDGAFETPSTSVSTIQTSESSDALFHYLPMKGSKRKANFSDTEAISTVSNSTLSNSTVSTSASGYVLPSQMMKRTPSTISESSTVEGSVSSASS